MQWSDWSSDVCSSDLMTDNVFKPTNDHVKSNGTISSNADDSVGDDKYPAAKGKRKLDCMTSDMDDADSSTDSSIHATAKKKHHRKRDNSENDRHRDLQSGDKKTKKKKRDRHDKKKKRHCDESNDSITDSDTLSDDGEYARRRKHDRKKSKKEKKRSNRQRYDESNDEKKGKKDNTIRRSVITGEKIQLKIEKTTEDVIQEQARKQLLDFMNASYK